MLDHVVEQARQQEIFSREDTDTEQRVWAAFLYHAGLSYRRVEAVLGYSHEAVLGYSHEAVRQWYHRLAHLFRPTPDHHGTIAVDETKVKIEDREVYVWAAADVDTFEVLHIEVSPGRSDLDALLFVDTVLNRCTNEPEIVVDRGPWYNWPLDDLGLPCTARRETWGDRSLIEAWFGLFKDRTRRFYSRFPHHSSWQSADRWAKAFATLHNALL